MANGFRLVVDQGSQAGRNFPLDRDVMTIGRDPSNTIVISEPQVSRQHARITRHGGVLVIEDLGSTNGTFVNGMRLAGPHTLSNGDVIGLGDAAMLTFAGTGMPATTEPAASAYPPAPQMAPSYAPPPYEAAPSYEAPPYEAPAPPEIPVYEEAPAPKKSRKGLFIGCGCLALLAITACLAVFILDYLQLLPSVFYEPLRWLGFF